MPTAYFLDTSALSPRYLPGAQGSAWAAHLCDPSRRNIVAIAEVTEVEISAALNQLARGRVIRNKRRDRSVTLFWSHVESDQYSIVSVTTSIVRQAAALCGLHALKGYDAIQLACAHDFRAELRAAAAAAAAQGRPPFGAPIFLTEDNRLRDAALAEGFAVDTPLAHP